jgi:hypothetical protein
MEQESAKNACRESISMTSTIIVRENAYSYSINTQIGLHLL